MARKPSAILSAAQQKAVDTTAALKAQLKTETATLKDLTKAEKTATTAAVKQGRVVAGLQAKLDKLTTPKVAATSTPVAQQAAA